MHFNRPLLVKVINVVAFLFCYYPEIALAINQNSREIPEEYIKKAIKIFKHKKGKIIVEIGSMRTPLSHELGKENCSACNDGHSTMWWATTGSEVYSVDISKRNIDLTSKICEKYKNVHAINQDGLDFLKSFKQPIDLLFLDAWDVTAGTRYAEKHLEAYLAAKPHLHARSLILIDDTDIEDCGKGKLVIPQAVKDGYKVIFTGRQTLLAK